MVRLRKSHTKLKIALCSVCGFFVAIEIGRAHV